MAVATPAPERAAGRRALAKRGRALSDGSFPVPDAQYWDKARQAIGRVKDPAKRAKVAALLRKTAPQVGRSAALKESWAAPGGSAHAGDSPGIGLAVRAKDDQGYTLTCPECSYSGPANRFGASGASVEAKPPLLRTPAPSTGYVRNGVPLKVNTSASHALANQNASVDLAATATAKRHPIHGPGDVLAARGENGTAVLKHRHGGDIASLRKENGKWVATVNGRDLEPRDMQRTAIMDAVGTWNKALSGAVARQEAPLQPAPEQTPLMAEYGIPAMRAATFATPVTSSGSGPRMTTAGGKGKNDPDHDGDDDYSVKGDTDKDYAGALGPKGRAAYAKLRRKMPAARALKLAKHVDTMGAKAA